MNYGTRWSCDRGTAELRVHTFITTYFEIYELRLILIMGSSHFELKLIL